MLHAAALARGAHWAWQLFTGRNRHWQHWPAPCTDSTHRSNAVAAPNELAVPALLTLHKQCKRRFYYNECATVRGSHGAM